MPWLMKLYPLSVRSCLFDRREPKLGSGAPGPSSAASRCVRIPQSVARLIGPLATEVGVSTFVEAPMIRQRRRQAPLGGPGQVGRAS
jgi:hypothetical protein